MNRFARQPTATSSTVTVSNRLGGKKSNQGTKLHFYNERQFIKTIFNGWMDYLQRWAFSRPITRTPTAVFCSSNNYGLKTIILVFLQKREKNFRTRCTLSGVIFLYTFLAFFLVLLSFVAFF